TKRFKLKLVDEYLLNIDVSDAQNRPDAKKLIEHKRKFFASIAPILSELSDREKKCIYCMHKFEVGYIYMKNRDVINAMKFIASVFASPKATRLAFRKTLKKIKEMSSR
ncbi:MAG: glycosyltransferase family 2 protein, partial [Oscillospiraceae bacterium]|nr:glycosyltransferase family 2 protein [Oscillospiraceae bacterium]